MPTAVDVDADVAVELTSDRDPTIFGPFPPRTEPKLKEKIKRIEGDFDRSKYDQPIETFGDWIDAIGPTIPLIETEVKRLPGIGGSEATIKTYVDQAQPFELIALERVYLTVTINVGGLTVFRGDVTKVKQDRKGVITLVAQDLNYRLLQHTVRLDTTSKGQPSPSIVWDLLVADEGAPLTSDQVYVGYGNNKSTINFDSADVSPPGFDPQESAPFDDTDYYDRFPNYPPEQSKPATIKDTWGLDQRPTVSSVIQQIARKEHAYLYVDGANNLHFVEVPPIAKWEPIYITEMDAGSTKKEQSRVIAKGPRTSGDGSLGGALPFMSADGVFAIAEADAASTDKVSSDALAMAVKEAWQVNDPNVQSITQASRTAVDTYITQNFAKESGTFTIMGDPRPTPYDTVVLTDDRVPSYAKLPSGQYTVRSVTHRINKNDGYVTDIKVGETLESLYNNVKDTDQISKKRRAKLAREQIRKEIGVAYYGTASPGT